MSQPRGYTPESLGKLNLAQQIMLLDNLRALLAAYQEAPDYSKKNDDIHVTQWSMNEVLIAIDVSDPH